MSNMFCFQCEQTAGGKGCTVAGVCGKTAHTAKLQDRLIGALVGLAKVAKPSERTDTLITNALFTTLTNVNFDDEAIFKKIEEVEREKALSGESQNSPDMNLEDLWSADEDERSLKSLILLGLKGMAAYAYHAQALGYSDKDVNAFFYKALKALGEEMPADKLFGTVMELGQVNYKCMELLDTANTSTYGSPIPKAVSLTIEKGPFIVVSGHDLKDLELLLKQTEGKGVNIYTHGEMLPAHAYPNLKKYPHLKGHFGTAWHNQQRELDGIPAPVLFTTNCLMPVRESYGDRVFTTGVVAFPGVAHIGEDRDFSPVIKKALELGGYGEDKTMPGLNGGTVVTTGFAKNAVLSNAGKIVDAVKAGAIRHFFLVGGCDGAKKGRNYYTEFVKLTPKDTVVLTLGCGKFRFNDIDIGGIGGLPRIMDMGQCNDAYSAIRVALALADAFKCGVNDLPLTLVLSWYEQKAVCILLTLLSLGVKNIYIGPSLPAFLSKNVLDILVEKFGLNPISTPKEDLGKILG